MPGTITIDIVGARNAIKRFFPENVYDLVIATRFEEIERVVLAFMRNVDINNSDELAKWYGKFFNTMLWSGISGPVSSVISKNMMTYTATYREYGLDESNTSSTEYVMVDKTALVNKPLIESISEMCFWSDIKYSYSIFYLANCPALVEKLPELKTFNDWVMSLVPTTRTVDIEKNPRFADHKDIFPSESSIIDIFAPSGQTVSKFMMATFINGNVFVIREAMKNIYDIISTLNLHDSDFIVPTEAQRIAEAASGDRVHENQMYTAIRTMASAALLLNILEFNVLVYDSRNSLIIQDRLIGL